MPSAGLDHDDGSSFYNDSSNFLVFGGCKNYKVGLHPIVTFQYSSTTLYQVSYHIQYLFF